MRIKKDIQLHESLAKKIQKYRALANMTQEELASDLGITLGTYKRYEGGDMISVDLLNILARYYKIPITDFFLPEEEDLRTITPSENEGQSKPLTREKVLEREILLALNDIEDPIMQELYLDLALTVSNSTSVKVRKKSEEVKKKLMEIDKSRG